MYDPSSRTSLSFVMAGGLSTDRRKPLDDVISILTTLVMVNDER